MDTASLFWEVHAGLPRQAPGSDATTRHLLAACGTLPESPVVLDVGCGPGRATLALAEDLPAARFVAIDLRRPFLEELRVAARAARVDTRVLTLRASMTDLPFADGCFDLLWCEGAVYNMGFEAGLRAWRRVLRPRATVVLTDATWFTHTPSPAAARFWREYPGMVDVDTSVRRAEAAGYEVLAIHRLPASDWWDEYYTPIQARLAAYDTRDPGVAKAVAAERAEIDLFRAHGDEYGYTGFVLRRID